MIWVVALLEIKPLLSCLIVSTAFQTRKCQDLFRNRFLSEIGNRLSRFRIIRKHILIGLLLSNVDLLHAEHIYHSAANQQQGQGNDSGNQQRTAKGFVPLGGSNGIIFRFIVILGADITQRDEQVFPGHRSIPSFSRQVCSFLRVRWSWVLTLLSLMPYRCAISATESTYR